MRARPTSDLSTPRPLGPVAVVLLAGFVCAGLAVSGLVPDARLVFLFAGAGLIGLGVGPGGAILWRLARRAARRSAVPDLFPDDAGAVLLTTGDGQVIAANSAARTRLGDALSGRLADTLRTLLPDPDPVILRLQARAGAGAVATDRVAGREGLLDLSVRAAGDGDFLWRIDRATPCPVSAEGLVPLVTLGEEGAVLDMNRAARRLVGRRVTRLDHLFPQLPVRTGAILPLTTAGGTVPVVLADAGDAGERQVAFLPLTDTGPPAGDAAFDALPVALVTLTLSGDIIRANAAAQALIGQDCAGRRLSDVVEGLGRSIPDWLRDAAARTGAPRTEVLRLTGREAETFVQVTVSRPRDGASDMLIAVLSDATELKTLEAQFVQSQKMQAIGQLAGGVAHDFNNLLTAISGYCDLLLLRHDTGDEDYGDLMQIHQNANRAAALVGQLLAFSRKQTLRAEVLDVRDTLADLTHLLNRLVGERVTLSLQHDPVLGAIRADRRQLEQVLMNLVVNARDAMPEGGEIRIVTEALHLSRPMERDRATVPPGDYVSVKVIDQGTGIAPDKLQKVFEPFFTTKRTGEGTGLGLSTAYGIIKQTGGFIFVDSAPGAGACFTLILPVCSDLALPDPDAAAARRRSAPVQGSGVVLLVEDEAPVRAFASRALQMRGFSVIEAASAEEALALLADPGLHVDLFVTDVVMPGLDGPTWVRRARETRPDVGVVFVSGYAEGAFGGSLPDFGNSVFLPKPFSLAQLTETVRDQLAAATVVESDALQSMLS